MNGKFDGDDVKETLSFNCSDILMGPTIYSYSCVNVTLSSGTSSLIFSQFQVRLISVILLGCLLNKSCRSSNLMINIIILFTEVEVASGGYMYQSREAVR